MATLNRVLDSLERNLGFRTSRSSGIARRLQEAGLLPLGAAGVSPVLDEDHVIDLVVAVASWTKLREAPDAVRSFHAMTPGGVSLEGAPTSIPNAQTALSILVEDARVGSAEARRSQIEVSCSWRAISINKADGTVARFCEVGALSEHWQAEGHHRSVTIDVAALANAMNELFGRMN